MGGAIKKVASVATLGLSDAVLGATDVPKSGTTAAADVDANDVSTIDADSYNADKKRRAQAAGLSSTILGGSTSAPATTAVKTLLGS